MQPKDSVHCLQIYWLIGFVLYFWSLLNGGFTVDVASIFFLITFNVQYIQILFNKLGKLLFRRIQ